MEKREWPLDLPEEKFDRALAVVKRLYEVARTGWVKMGVKNPETVGEHTDALIKLAEQICDIDKSIDRKKLLRMLQIHDWAEADPDVGDIVAVHSDPATQKSISRNKYARELAAIKNICSKLGDEGKEILALWQEFEGGTSPEAKVAFQIDKAQAILKAFEYRKAGEPVDAQEFLNSSDHKINYPYLRALIESAKQE